MDERDFQAVAQDILRQHGFRSELFVALQVGRLELAGDRSGAEVWRQIGARVLGLQRSKLG